MTISDQEWKDLKEKERLGIEWILTPTYKEMREKKEEFMKKKGVNNELTEKKRK